jgi:hypothetical protein
MLSTHQLSAETIHLFGVADFGIDANRFVDSIDPTFSDLPWDQYDLRKAQLRILEQHVGESDADFLRLGQAYYAGSVSVSELSLWVDRLPPEAKEQFCKALPFRRRSIASFAMEKSATETAGDWDIIRQPNRPFQMNVSGYRAIARLFAPMAEEVADHADVQKLLVVLADELCTHRPATRALRITLHQVSCVARPDKPATNAPEGIHQDGASFIVSALVISRNAVQGGVSTIYADDRRTVLKRVCLGAGQGLFHADADSSLWHDVTPISTEVDAAAGSRNTLGFDFDIIQ